jgi:DNA-entry nuclease
MEARSIEDPLVQFCAFCYNVQPGIEIDYATGESRLMEESGEAPSRSVPTGGEAENGETSGGSTGSPENNSDSGNRGPAVSSGNSQEQQEYVVNVRSRIFHHPYCDSVKKMKEKNKQNFTGQRNELIDKGYKPCQNCNP